MNKWIGRLIFATILLCSLIRPLPNNAIATEFGLKVHFIDVGQADATIIECDGQVMMIDGGNATDSNLIYSYLKKTLGISHIDYMVATHPHEDHIGGLSGALNACTVGTLYSPVKEYDSKFFSSLKKYADKQNLSLTMPPIDQPISFGSGYFEFFSPRKDYSDPNNQSLVLKLTYGETSFLFTGDAEWDAEHDMVEAGVDLNATVLKVGHHGSNSSSSYVFLREVMPQYAVISVGADNRYVHPTDEVLSRLIDADVTVYQTDLQGTVLCESDGQSVKFSTEKEGKVPISINASQRKQEQLPVVSSTKYVLNTNTKKFHYPDCKSVKEIKDKNKKEVDFSREELISQGYKPCGNCNP